MVECSENNINFPDQRQWQAISPLLYSTLLADEHTISPLLYIFWAGGLK